MSQKWGLCDYGIDGSMHEPVLNLNCLCMYCWIISQIVLNLTVFAVLFVSWKRFVRIRKIYITANGPNASCFDMLFVMVQLWANLLKCVFIGILLELKKVQITHFPKRENIWIVLNWAYMVHVLLLLCLCWKKI